MKKFINLKESNEGLMGVFSGCICIDHAHWNGSQGPLLCMCVSVCAGVYMHVCGDQKSASGVVPQEMPFLSFTGAWGSVSRPGW